MPTKVIRCETWDQVEAAIAELNTSGIRCYVETKQVGMELHLIALTSTGFSAGYEVHIPMTLVAGGNSEELHPRAVEAVRAADLYTRLSTRVESDAEYHMAANESILLGE